MATEVGDTYRPKRRDKRAFPSRDGKRDLKIRKRIILAADFQDPGPIKTTLLLRVHPLLYERLCELAKTGLFGFHAEDVAERLISEQLRQLLRQQ